MTNRDYQFGGPVASGQGANSPGNPTSCADQDAGPRYSLKEIEQWWAEELPLYMEDALVEWFAGLAWPDAPEEVRNALHNALGIACQELAGARNGPFSRRLDLEGDHRQWAEDVMESCHARSER